MTPPRTTPYRASATNGAAVVTLTAPTDPAMCWVIEGYAASADAAPAAAVTFTITDSGTTYEELEIPAAAFSPIICGTPMKGGKGLAMVATLPALGDGVTGTVRLSARQELF
jgi:hypothetical protein